MSTKKQTKRAARMLRENKGQPGAVGKVAMALASARLTTYARLVEIQAHRLEKNPPEDAEALCQWQADYAALWEQYPDLCDDNALWPVQTCKALAEGPLQQLHDRASAMGAKVTIHDKLAVQRSRGQGGGHDTL